MSFGTDQIPPCKDPTSHPSYLDRTNIAVAKLTMSEDLGAHQDAAVWALTCQYPYPRKRHFSLLKMSDSPLNAELRHSQRFCDGDPSPGARGTAWTNT